MSETLERSQFFNKVRAGQQQLIEALRQVPAGEALKPVRPGGWSVKDLAVHITYWQVLANRQIQAILRGLPPEREPATSADVDAHNRAAVEESSAKDYDEVVRDFELSCINLSNSLELVSADDLIQEYEYNQTASKPLWQTIAVNTYEHFEEHLQDLENWKAQD
jgi:uncharacterized damage-inducible protein DinB